MSEEASKPPNRLFGGFESHSFRRLAQACSLSSAGDAFIAVAMAGSLFFSEDPNQARSNVALSLLLTMAPFAVVAPFLGPWVDRARGGRRFVLASSGAVRALLCLLIASSLDQPWLYPMVFLALVCSKTHAVAKSAAVPELVGPTSDLVRANSVLQIFAVVSGFLAAIIGGVVGAVGGDEWVVRIAALVFAAEAALVLEVGATAPPEAREQGSTPINELRKAGVLPSAVVMACMRMIVGYTTFLVAFDLRRDEAPIWMFGVVVGAGMVGASAGNLMAPLLRGKVREEWMLFTCGAGLGIAAALAAGLEGFAANVALAGLVGLGAGAAKLAFDSLVQRDALASVHGRSFARFETFFQLVWVVGALVPVMITISPRVGFLLITFVCAAAITWYARTGLRRRPAAA